MNETKLAKQSLLLKENNGSFLYLLKRSFLNYLLFILVIFLSWVLLSMYCPSNYQNIRFFVSGMVIGAILRDLGWFRRIKITWPFTLKVTDWDKVKKLSETAN